MEGIPEGFEHVGGIECWWGVTDIDSNFRPIISDVGQPVNDRAPWLSWYTDPKDAYAAGIKWIAESQRLKLTVRRAFRVDCMWLWVAG